MSKRKETKPTNTNTARTVAAVSTSESTPSKPISQWVYVGIAAIFVAIIIMARMNLASIPFERDEGSYGYMGQLLLEGKKPYQYFYEMKLPGIFYCYAAIVALFGKTIDGLHIGFMFVTLISTVVIFLTGKILFDARSGAVAAIAFSILTLCKYASGFAAQGEHFVVMWSLLGIYSILCAIQSGKWFEYFAAGIFLGMAVLVKQSGVFFALAAGLFMVIHYLKPLNIKAMIINGAILVGGFAAIVGIFFSSVASQGGWNDMMYWVFEYPKLYVSAIPFDMGMNMMKGSVDGISRDYMGLWYFAGFGLVLVWFTSLKLYKKAGLSLLLALAFASTAPGMRFYGHYFIQFMPALAILIAAFVYSVGNITTEKMNFKLGGTLAFVVFLLVSAFTMKKQSDYYFSKDYFTTLRQVYGDNPFVESKPVADKIKSLGKEDDQLMVLGAEPQLYFYTQMHCPTRHSFLSFTSPMNDKAKEWRKEVIKNVEDTKPAFIVLVNHPFAWSYSPDSDQEIYKWGYAYATQNYDLVGFADIIPNSRPAYVWDAAALTYKPKGQKYMVVFKRKAGI